MWPNESKYVGDFELHKRHGDGRFVSEDKLTYDGQFKEGVFEGYGFVLAANGKVIEEGRFENWLLVEELETGTVISMRASEFKNLQVIEEADDSGDTMEDHETESFELVEKG